MTTISSMTTQGDVFHVPPGQGSHFDLCWAELFIVIMCTVTMHERLLSMKKL